MNNQGIIEFGFKSLNKSYSLPCLSISESQLEEDNEDFGEEDSFGEDVSSIYETDSSLEEDDILLSETESDNQSFLLDENNQTFLHSLGISN